MSRGFPFWKNRTNICGLTEAISTGPDGILPVLFVLKLLVRAANGTLVAGGSEDGGKAVIGLCKSVVGDANSELKTGCGS
jgi:hypothetical protein